MPRTFHHVTWFQLARIVAKIELLSTAICVFLCHDFRPPFNFNATTTVFQSWVINSVSVHVLLLRTCKLHTLYWGTNKRLVFTVVVGISFSSFAIPLFMLRLNRQKKEEKGWNPCGATTLYSVIPYFPPDIRMPQSFSPESSDPSTSVGKAWDRASLKHEEHIVWLSYSCQILLIYAKLLKSVVSSPVFLFKLFNLVNRGVLALFLSGNNTENYQ